MNHTPRQPKRKAEAVAAEAAATVEAGNISNAIERWNKVITTTSQRYVIPGRNEPEDLKQEAIMQLLGVMRDHPDWNPVSSVDFQRVFLASIKRRIIDLVRYERRKQRNPNLEVQYGLFLPRLEGVIDGEKTVNLQQERRAIEKRFPSYFVDPRSEYESAENSSVGQDLYIKVLSDLDDDQREILSLLIHPHEQFIRFSMRKKHAEDSDLENIRLFLKLDDKEMDYHMNRIRQVTSNVQSDYSSESIHSVVHILALPEDRSTVPYWCVWECLDGLSRRLLALMVFSDLPTSTTIGKLSCILCQPRKEVIIELDKIKQVVKKLFQEGVTVTKPTRSSVACAVRGCEERALFTCYETEVRGCDEHLGHCIYNPKHRFVPSMRLIHEEWCKENKLGHSRNCEYPGCSATRYAARCYDTGSRGCEQHMLTCEHGHRVMQGRKVEHDIWCKKNPESWVEKEGTS